MPICSFILYFFKANLIQKYKKRNLKKEKNLTVSGIEPRKSLRSDSNRLKNRAYISTPKTDNFFAADSNDSWRHTIFKTAKRYRCEASGTYIYSVKRVVGVRQFAACGAQIGAQMPTSQLVTTYASCSQPQAARASLSAGPAVVLKHSSRSYYLFTLCVRYLERSVRGFHTACEAVQHRSCFDKKRGVGPEVLF